MKHSEHLFFVHALCWQSFPMDDGPNRSKWHCKYTGWPHSKRENLMRNGRKEMENFLENKTPSQIWQRWTSTETLFSIFMGNPWIILRNGYCWCKSDEKNLGGFFQHIWQYRKVKQWYCYQDHRWIILKTERKLNAVG